MSSNLRRFVYTIPLVSQRITGKLIGCLHGIIASTVLRNSSRKRGIGELREAEASFVRSGLDVLELA